MKNKEFDIEQRKITISEAKLKGVLDRVREDVITDPELLIKLSNVLISDYHNLFGIVKGDIGQIPWFTYATVFQLNNKNYNKLEKEDSIINEFKDLFKDANPTDRFKQMYQSICTDDSTTKERYSEYKAAFNNTTTDEFKLMLMVHRHFLVGDSKPGLYGTEITRPTNINIDSLRGLKDNLTNSLEILILESIGGLTKEEKDELINYELRLSILKDKVSKDNIDNHINYLKEPLSFLIDKDNLDQTIKFCINKGTFFRSKVTNQGFDDRVEQELRGYFPEYLELEKKVKATAAELASLQTKFEKKSKGIDLISKPLEELVKDPQFKSFIAGQPELLKTFKERKQTYEKAEEECKNFWEKARRELAILMDIEDLIFFEPRLILSAEVIQKLINAFKATDYIINNSLTEPSNIQNYIKTALEQAGLTKKCKSISVKDLGIIRSIKDAPYLKEVEKLSDPVKQRIAKAARELDSELTKLIDESSSKPEDKIINDIKIQVEGIKIKQPISRDYTILNNLLMEVDPSSVRELINDDFKLEALTYLSEDNKKIDSKEFKNEVKKLLKINNAPEPVINEAINALKEWLNQYPDTPLPFIAGLLRLDRERVITLKS